MAFAFTKDQQKIHDLEKLIAENRRINEDYVAATNHEASMAETRKKLAVEKALAAQEVIHQAAISKLEHTLREGNAKVDAKNNEIANLKKEIEYHKALVENYKAMPNLHKAIENIQTMLTPTLDSLTTLTKTLSETDTAKLAELLKANKAAPVDYSRIHDIVNSLIRNPQRGGHYDPRF